MKKLFAVLFLAFVLLLLLGCKTASKEIVVPKLEVEIAQEDLEAGISEADALDQDLDTSDLEDIDAQIDELEETNK